MCTALYRNWQILIVVDSGAWSIANWITYMDGYMYTTILTEPKRLSDDKL